LSTIIPLRLVVTDLATDEVFTTIKCWILDCQLNHKSCYYQNNLLLPSRLIDVVRDLRAAIVKLHITHKAERGAYVALSYCWGGPQPVTTTTSNLESMKFGLELLSLPQTIQDAIEVTRKLGFRFLWVDALCIIQDSVTHKEKEIQKMGNIYKNAKGVSDGFLRLVRIPPESCEFHFQVPNKGKSTIFVSLWGSFIPSHPLDERGWALQESLLSHRLLEYSEKELTWHCQTDTYKTVTKSCPDYLPMMKRLPPRVFNDKFRGVKSWTTQKQRVELWRSLVQNYSSRSLTNGEDRLNALVGVSNELGNI